MVVRSLTTILDYTRMGRSGDILLLQSVTHPPFVFRFQADTLQARPSLILQDQPRVHPEAFSATATWISSCLAFGLRLV